MRITELPLRNNRLLWVILVCFVVIAAGAAIGQMVTQGWLIEPLIVGMVALLALFLLLQNRAIGALLSQRSLLYLAIIAGFIGPAFLAIPVGSIHIFPYRVLLPLLSPRRVPSRSRCRPAGP